MRNDSPSYSLRIHFLYIIPGQILYCEAVRASTMPRPRPFKSDSQKVWLQHCFTENLLLQRTIARNIILERNIPVLASNAQESKNCNKIYKGFVKGVRHLILEVLRSHCVFKHKINKRETFVKLNGRRTKNVQRIFPIFVFEGKNFIASTANIRVDVE